MTIIGVDPAYRDEGFGIVIFRPNENSLQKVKCKNLWEFETILLRWVNPAENIYIAIENSMLQSATFIPRNYNPKTKRLENDESYGNRCQRVGMNRAVSQMAVDKAIELFGKQYVVQFSPKEKGATEPQSVFELRLKKHNIPLTKELTRTNSDIRSAFMCASKALSIIKLKEKIK